MSPKECRREQEVLSAARLRGWRETCNEELKRHIEQCEICGDLVTVSEVMREDHDLILRDLQLPGAGQVWWRAAVRARAEAADTAVRPLTWAHGIAGACAVGLSIAAVGIAWPTVWEWASSLAWRVDPNGTMVADLVAAARTRLPLLLTVAACLVLAPIALYFALSDEESD